MPTQSPVRYCLPPAERPVGARGAAALRAAAQADIRLVRDDGIEEAFALPPAPCRPSPICSTSLLRRMPSRCLPKTPRSRPRKAGILGMSRPLVRQRMIRPAAFAASARTDASGWPTRWRCAHARNRCAKRWRRSPPIPRISSARIEYKGPGRPPPVVLSRIALIGGLASPMVDRRVKVCTSSADAVDWRRGTAMADADYLSEFAGSTFAGTPGHSHRHRTCSGRWPLLKSAPRDRNLIWIYFESGIDGKPCGSEFGVFSRQTIYTMRSVEISSIIYQISGRNCQRTGNVGNRLPSLTSQRYSIVN